MKLYKIRGYVNKRVKRGRAKGSLERVFEVEHIIKNNLETARSIYNSVLNEVKTYYYNGYIGHAELFIPHVFEDGQLAYWPDKNKYIEQYNSKEVTEDG